MESHSHRPRRAHRQTSIVRNDLDRRCPTGSDDHGSSAGHASDSAEWTDGGAPVAGNGEFKYQSYLYRAIGFTATTSAAGTRSSQSVKPSGTAGSGEQPGKAA